MNTHAAINPALLVWARERAGMDASMLAGDFPSLAAWEAGERRPTLKQLEAFARAVHVPVGYLFLPAPVQEKLPIADFRTVAGSDTARPSPDLLDTLYLCQQRQDWYRDHARINGFPSLDFIGSAAADSAPAPVAESMRRTLKISLKEREHLSSWEVSLRQLAAHAEDAGILVMTDGIVGSNTSRKLRVEEFRGFALADNLAPLVFINGTDSRAAQMLTLAHELAHLWLGTSGISNIEVAHFPEHDTEKWCNAVAAEFLIPLQTLNQEFSPRNPLKEETKRLARKFKVSTLVVLRRIFDAGFIDREQFRHQCRMVMTDFNSQTHSSIDDCNFFRSPAARTGRRFARALLGSTLEGQTLFRDAFRLLADKKECCALQRSVQYGGGAMICLPDANVRERTVDGRRRPSQMTPADGWQ